MTSKKLNYKNDKKFNVEINGKKQFWKSKTVWVNGLALLGGIVTAISGELATGGTVTMLTVANIVLRVVSKSKLVKN